MCNRESADTSLHQAIAPYASAAPRGGYGYPKVLLLSYSVTVAEVGGNESGADSVPSLYAKIITY